MADSWVASGQGLRSCLAHLKATQILTLLTLFPCLEGPSSGLQNTHLTSLRKRQCPLLWGSNGTDFKSVPASLQYGLGLNRFPSS